MSKIAVITDTHTGIKNGSGVFLDYMERFYDEVFFPYCKKNNISQILHLGDYFDHRRFANFKVLSRNRCMFIDRLKEEGMTMDLIPGNHDTYYKNTNDLNSLTEILSHYEDVIKLHMDPTVVSYDGLDIGLLPWINEENYEECIDFVKNVKAPFLGGHLELAGFDMMKGVQASSHGMASDIFSRFELVMSGHYHTKSTKGNIHYLGTPYELTWADCDDPKYFHVIDTETRELTPVRNKITIYNRLRYDDISASDDVEAELKKIDFDAVSGSYIKVVVVNKKNPFLFDKYIDEIVARNPFDLKIVENFDEYLSDNVDESALELTDTITLLNTYVDSVQTDLDRDRIKNKLQELYVEAQTLDAL
jgi:DNA repair exonuclease SbcCD nuclease subunit